MPKNCLYGSDRGAVFVTTEIRQAIEPGLRDARKPCVKGIRPVEVGRRGFVCVEVHDDRQIIAGNTTDEGRLWLLTILPLSGEATEQELKAMIALVGAAKG